MKNRKKIFRGGFTLVEIMVVVIILGILATVVVIAVTPRIKRAKIEKAKSDVRAIEEAIELFKMEKGKLPDSLEQLVGGTSEGGDSYLKTLHKDPWKNDYIYRKPGEGGREYEVVCKGPDGKENTKDDIVNWKIGKEEGDEK